MPRPVGPALLALLLVLALAAAAMGLLWRPMAAGNPTVLPRPSATSGDASLGASPSPAPSATARARGDVAWWRMDVRADPPVVRVGTIERGETVAIPLQAREPIGPVAPPDPGMRILGPVAGRVVLVEADGRGSTLMVVHAATGEPRHLLRSADRVLDAEMTRDEVVFVTGAPDDGTPTGAWSVALAGGEPEPIAGLLGMQRAVRFVAIVPWITDLVLSGDGRRVALLRCVEVDCELRSVGRQGGADVAHPIEWGQRPIALVGSLAVLENACVDVDCDLALLDLETGARIELPRLADAPAWRGAIVGGSGSVLAVTRIGAGGGAAAVELVDLADMEVGRLGIALETASVMQPGGRDAGVETPPGTFVVIGRPAGADLDDMRWFLVDAATGALTEIEPLGRVAADG